MLANIKNSIGTTFSTLDETLQVAETAARTAKYWMQQHEVNQLKLRELAEKNANAVLQERDLELDIRLHKIKQKREQFLAQQKLETK